MTENLENKSKYHDRSTRGEPLAGEGYAFMILASVEDDGGGGGGGAAAPER